MEVAVYDDQAGQVVVFASVSDGDDRLHDVLRRLVGVPNGPTPPFLSSVDSIDDIGGRIGRAAYVIIQAPTGGASPEVVAAAGIATSAGIPLLLVLCEASRDDALTRTANLPPSEILRYPDDREDAAGWAALAERMEERAHRVHAAVARAAYQDYFRGIDTHVDGFKQALLGAPPSAPVTLAVTKLFDEHVGGVKLERHVDSLELTIPASLYPQLLNKLTNTFDSVRAIADPFDEELPWDDPGDLKALTGVTDRMFLVDEAYARQFGLESILGPIVAAAQASRTGAVACVGVDPDMRATANATLSANPELKGLNRFYAGDNLVGGYDDARRERVRLIAYTDPGSTHGEYRRERDVLESIDARRRPVPPDRTKDPTSLASWIYSNVLTRPSLEAIYEHDRPAYAENYDGNIVRVTPGYYSQLDAFAREAKRALVSLLSPFANREPSDLRILELGVGTGTFTGRLMRTCASLLLEVYGPVRPGTDRPDVVIEGWDANQRMVEIANERLETYRRDTEDFLLQPRLVHRQFEPESTEPDNGEWDYIVGSLFSHYWIDFLQNRPVTSPDGLVRFTGFLEGTRRLLRRQSGGVVQFLDVFYSADRRRDEERAWRDYVRAELGSTESADAYLRQNLWQLYAPSTDIVAAAAERTGFQVTTTEANPGIPFRIVTFVDAP